MCVCVCVCVCVSVRTVVSMSSHTDQYGSLSCVVNRTMCCLASPHACIVHTNTHIRTHTEHATVQNTTWHDVLLGLTTCLQCARIWHTQYSTLHGSMCCVAHCCEVHTYMTHTVVTHTLHTHTHTHTCAVCTVRLQLRDSVSRVCVCVCARVCICAYAYLAYVGRHQVIRKAPCNQPRCSDVQYTPAGQLTKQP